MRSNFAPTGLYTRRIATVLVFMLATGMHVQPVNAEFKIGTKIEEFSLKTLNDQSFSLKRSGDAIELQGSESVQPKVLMIHFFQPDCPQCHAELKALQKIHEEFKDKELTVIGVAHRGDAEVVQNLAKQLKITFTLLMGVDSEIAKQLAAGDALGMLDSKGIVRFAQVGYAGSGDDEGDENVWRKNIKRLLAGKPVAQDTVKRERLRAGDAMPAVKLNSLFNEKPIALVSVDGRLTFQDEQGHSTHPKAAVGLFSRYCAFTREEMVELQKFHEKYGKDGLQVFAIAMVPDIDEARKVTRELGLTYPIFYGHGSQLGKQYAYGCPAYILDSKGKIRHTQVGFEKGDERRYETIIKTLLTP